MRDEKPISAVVFEWENPESIKFQVRLEGVTPWQMIQAAAYLEFLGKAGMAQWHMSQTHPDPNKQILVPKIQGVPPRP